MPAMYGPRAPLGICREFFVSRSEVHALSLTPTREQTVINCSQIGLASPSSVFKRINVRSPGYMSDLLVNEGNNRNNSLNLVCPRFKLETEGWGGGVAGTYSWCEGNKIVECSAKFSKED